MKEIAEHIDELIAKALANEATAKEWAELNNWICEHNDHNEYYQQMKMIHAQSLLLNEGVAFDVDAAWQKVDAATRQEAKVISIQSKIVRSQWMKIAAVIVLSLGVGWGLWKMNSPEKQFAYQALDAVVKDTLPDGTMAVLNAHSKIDYHFNSKTKTRTAQLKGEAHFTIAKNDNEQFIVQADDLLIRDIGTAFNVKAFPNSDTITVSVDEGEVILYTKADKGLNIVAGETAYYIKSQQKIEKALQPDENASSYANRIFKYRDAKISKVLKELGQVYETQLLLSNEQLGNCRITAQFNNESIEVITSVIAETMGWSIENINNQWIFKGDHCE